jgi:predicted nucleic-acid-binding protein
MIALDTNVLVRYLMLDDEQQSRRAAVLVEGATDSGEKLYISHIVLCELTWVLGRAYKLQKPDLLTALSSILRTAEIEVEAADLANRALRRFLAGHADFADYLIAERAAEAGCTGLATFDARLREEGGCFAP